MLENNVQLIRRILDGDDAAFSTLARKYQKGVHALVWRKVGDFHVAIAYSSKRNGLYGIYVMNADGNGVTAIADDLQLALTPVWSPKPLAISPKGKSSTLWGSLKIEQ